MDENLIDGIPAINEELDQELDVNLDGDSTETVEELKASLAKEVEARKQLTARAKQEQAKRKELEAKLKESQPKPSGESTKDTPKYDLDEVTDLRLDGFTKDEVKFIMNNGGRKALEEDPFVKVAIEQIRTQKKAEAAIPEGESNKSEIEKKYTQKQLSEMSAEELYKILPKSNR